MHKISEVRGGMFGAGEGRSGVTVVMENGVKGERGVVREGESLMLGKRSGEVDTESTRGGGGGEAPQSQPAASPAPTSAEASR